MKSVTYYYNIILCLTCKVLLKYITCIMVINKSHTISEELYSVSKSHKYLLKFTKFYLNE